MINSFLQQLHYVRLPVKNLEASIQWYTESLGFQLAEITEQNFAVIKLEEGPLLVLVPTEDATFGHFTRQGVAEFSVAFTCPEIKRFHQYLKEQHVKVEEIQEDHGHLFFCFFDPNGNKLQVHW